ncbi:MAG: 3-oxoacyl-[acyl-carrier-protein] synthase 2 [Candidatus Binatia bacterium]|nr:MAG: 3-oxoacyl-[acyl-carrier-protein] synthase 2 [Candidatus Binatia bacterium]
MGWLAMGSRRVVVTGLGGVTPLGTGVETIWESACAGRSGIGPITLFDASNQLCRIAGEVKGFDPERFVPAKHLRRMDDFSRYAVGASVLAVEDAGLVLSSEDPVRVGVVLGNNNGGARTIFRTIARFLAEGPESVSPFYITAITTNMCSAQVAMRLGIRGPNFTIGNACASGLNAIGEAWRYVRDGTCDVVLAGGTDALIDPSEVAGFANSRAVSLRNDEPEKASRPFDRDRDGFVLSEGAAVLVLESLDHALERGARIYAEIVGYATTSEAYHIASPRPNGEGVAETMRAALASAGLAPEEIDYVNAHATSTPVGDVNETQGIKLVFGKHAYRLAVSAPKSMTGHLIGASGALEALLTVKTLETGILTPTINLDHPDPECDLDYVPHRARKGEVRYALTNSFGFGGANASMVLKRWEP